MTYLGNVPHVIARNTDPGKGNVGRKSEMSGSYTAGVQELKSDQFSRHVNTPLPCISVALARAGREIHKHKYRTRSCLTKRRGSHDW